MKPIPGLRCSPPARRTAPARAGSRNMPTRASATSSSGACSTRTSCSPRCGASRATRSGSRSTGRGCPGRARLSRSPATRRRLPVRRHRPRRHRGRELLPQRAYAGFEVDAERWPSTAGFVARTLAHSVFASLLPFEDVQRGAEIKGRRQALLDAGRAADRGNWARASRAAG